MHRYLAANLHSETTMPRSMLPRGRLSGEPELLINLISSGTSSQQGHTPSRLVMHSFPDQVAAYHSSQRPPHLEEPPPSRELEAADEAGLKVPEEKVSVQAKGTWAKKEKKALPFISRPCG
ncbi:hypothetical protein RUND412_007748 [Rhizina undulata]